MQSVVSSPDPTSHEEEGLVNLGCMIPWACIEEFSHANLWHSHMTSLL